MTFHEKLGMTFPHVPFIWHYDDFANLYKTHKILQIDKQKMIKMLETCGNKDVLNDILDLDDNTEFYIHSQYKGEEVYYNNKSNEIYLSFHTWLYGLETKKTKIGNNHLDHEYKFDCSVYDVSGYIEPSEFYPIKKIVDRKRKRIMCLTSGIGINEMTKRVHSIHYAKNFNRFSPHDECNLNLVPGQSQNFVFVSIIKNPMAKTKSEKFRDNKKSTFEKLNKNCVTLHIFRNETDNNPTDPEFQNIVTKYMI